MIVKVKDKYFESVQTDLWNALAPIEVVEAEAPRNHWEGGKIPVSLWDQVLGFFEWSLAETQSETVVSLFYSRDRREWAAAAMPQKGHTGMTVALLPDHDNWAPTLHLVGEEFEEMGTVHHHCRTSAFQSGTDHKDELTKVGLHVTIGHVGSQEYSLHARTSFRQAILPAALSDWFEAPEAIAGLPGKLLDGVLHHLLTRPRSGAEFPAWWKENVVRVPPPPPVVARSPIHWAAGAFGSGGFQGFGVPAVVQSTPFPQRRNTREEFKTELFRICRRYDIDPSELTEHLKEYADDPLLDELVSAMVWCDTSNLDEALEEMKELEEEHLKELKDDETQTNLFTEGAD